MFGRISIPLRKFLNIKCPLGSAKNRKHAPWITHGLMNVKKRRGSTRKQQDLADKSHGCVLLHKQLIKNAGNSSRKEHINKISEDLKISGTRNRFRATSHRPVKDQTS